MVNLLIGKPLPMRRNRSPFQDLCDCTHCTLAVDGQAAQPVAGAGNPNARLIFVGEAPGATEVVVGQPFVGESGRLLDHALEAVGLSRQDVYCTNAVLCRPEGNRDPSKLEVTACNQRLKREILSLPNRQVIVVLGTPAVKAVVGRNDGVTSLLYHSEWHADYHCFVLYSFHPAACLRNTDDTLDLIHTFKRAKELLSYPNAPLSAPAFPYVLENNVEKALERLARFQTELTDFISCDIETQGERPGDDARDWRYAVLTQLGFGFSWKGQDLAYLIPADIVNDFRVRQALKTFFARRDIIWMWHNGKYDTKVLRKAGFSECTIDRDTQLMHKSIDERIGKHRLKQLAGKYYNDFDYESAKDSALGFTTPAYHTKDCVYTLRLGRDTLPAEFASEVPSPNGYPNPLERHTTVMIPFWNTLVRTESRGVRIDETYLESLLVSYEGRLATIEAHCQELAGITFPEEHTVVEKSIVQTYHKKTGKPNKPKERTTRTKVIEHIPINIRSGVQIAELLYNTLGYEIPKHTEKGAPSVDEEVLTLFKNRHPFIEELLYYRQQHKLYSTYIKGVKKRLFYGRIYPSIGFNPVTGRTSATEPNTQNIPKDDTSIKRMYIPSDGYVMMEADYSNQEVRGASFFARDAALRMSCAQTDFHMNVAENVFRSHFDQIAACTHNLDALVALLRTQTAYKQLLHRHSVEPFPTARELADAMRDVWRKAAKAITFGIVYGEGPPGLQDTLYKKNSIEISLHESASYIQSWLGMYRQLASWLARQRHLIETVGFVDTPTGHRRRKHLITQETRGDAQREAMNSPIQSLSSDMTVMSFTMLYTLLTEADIGYPLFPIHDSILFEIRKGREQEAKAIIKETMEHILDPWQDPTFYVPFPVDVKMGSNWGELKKAT